VNGAIAEVHQLLGMARNEIGVVADVAGIGAGRRIARVQRGRHCGIGNGARHAAVADHLKLPVPTGHRHPDFDLDVRVARRRERGGDAAERRHLRIELRGGAAAASAPGCWRPERARGDRLRTGDGRRWTAEAEEILTRGSERFGGEGAERGEKDRRDEKSMHGALRRWVFRRPDYAPERGPAGASKAREWRSISG
jgi:hypothetical protein